MDRGARVAFGHFGAVRVQDERDVCVGGWDFAKGLEELEVLGRVHEVVLAANDVGEAHLEIIDDVDEVEDEGSVRSADNHVGGVGFVGVVDGDFTADEVLHGDWFAFEAEAPGAVVFVDAAGVLEFFEPSGVDILSLRLEIWSAVTAGLVTFVPVDAEPFEAGEDGLAGFFGVACFVGVLDAENKISAVLPGVEPVEESGARPSNVQVASGRGGESGPDGCRHRASYSVGARDGQWLVGERIAFVFRNFPRALLFTQALRPDRGSGLWRGGSSSASFCGSWDDGVVDETGWGCGGIADQDGSFVRWVGSGRS